MTQETSSHLSAFFQWHSNRKIASSFDAAQCGTGQMIVLGIKERLSTTSQKYLGKKTT
jgi:hypothetical protein